MYLCERCQAEPTALHNFSTFIYTLSKETRPKKSPTIETRICAVSGPSKRSNDSSWTCRNDSYKDRTEHRLYLTRYEPQPRPSDGPVHAWVAGGEEDGGGQRVGGEQEQGEQRAHHHHPHCGGQPLALSKLPLPLLPLWTGVSTSGSGRVSGYLL